MIITTPKTLGGSRGLGLRTQGGYANLDRPRTVGGPEA